MLAIQILIFISIVLSMAYFRMPAVVWTSVIGVTLIAFAIFGSLGFVFLIVAFILYFAAAAYANLTIYRKQYFTKPMILALQKRMPPMSSGERDAIEAGDVWWEKELFCGQPNWKKLLQMPKPALSAEELLFLENQVETLCQKINEWDVIQHKDLSEDVWDYLKKERFFGLVIPKEYGGLGFSAIAHSTIVMKIASRCMSAAVNTMVPNSLGPAELILHYGTTEQKDYYLPRLARGEEIPSFALTAPEAGSDAASITDSGIVCRGMFEGKEILGIRLSWDKRYITLAPVASVLGIAFRMFDPDHLLGNKEDIGITLGLIPTKHPGVEIGTRHMPMGLGFMNGPTRGKDVFIPMDWIIGGVERAGFGWRMIMESLAIGRAISLPALSTACGKLTYRMTGAYARLRKQFNVPISQFEGIEEALSEIAGFTYILESGRMMTAGAVDQKVRPAIASAIAKYHMTELSRRVIAHAMDIHAGQMIQMGPRNFLAAKHFSIPISITVEGANILTRSLIIFGQGAIRCHPYIQREVELLSVENVENNLDQLDGLLQSHIGYTVSNLARSFVGGVTGGYLFASPTRGRTAKYYRQLTRMSSALALLSDMCMLILGGNLKRKERISARLGDILSQLYLASSVLKYDKDHGSPQSDAYYVKWSVEKCLYDIQVACNELFNNFPIRWLGKLLRVIIFPWGAAYHKPTDFVSHKIVAAMVDPSPFRDRLTQYCYIAKDDEDSMRRMENALLKTKEVDPIWKKFQTGVKNGKVPRLGTLDDRIQASYQNGVLTEHETTLLNEFNQIYQEVIQVNEFTFDLSTIVK